MFFPAGRYSRPAASSAQKKLAHVSNVGLDRLQCRGPLWIDNLRKRLHGFKTTRLCGCAGRSQLFRCSGKLVFLFWPLLWVHTSAQNLSGLRGGECSVMTSEEPTTPIGEEPTATTSGERSAAAQPTRALSADLSSEELAILEFERN